MPESRLKQRVWLMKDSVRSEGHITSVSLPHPRDLSISAKFLVTNETCYELKVYSQNYHSWFINQHVVSDGKLYMMLEMDPIFLLLPHLHAFNQKVRPFIYGIN